ncbi:MAG: serine/threonine protein kinase [Aphanocapsa lilacina HA4352-LM1]|nr:serine/threonine protein kinase [Aphanocapsa lilacina HA4352-LM1]
MSEISLPTVASFQGRRDPLLGRTVGRYRLVEKIGVGGMGSVYRAVHVEIDDLTAAVKLLSQSLNTNDLRQRFRNEAAICARLSERSPYIVQIYDYGILDDLDLPYFTMEFLKGHALDDLAGSPLPLEQVVAIGVQLCEGLQVAHDLGVVHRDLKPGNIYLSGDPQSGWRVKILDFGIAKLVSEAMVYGERRQLTHGYLGTPRYSAPEQLRGEAVTVLSDVYGLGMILYELFSGTDPFVLADQSFNCWYHAHTERLPRSIAQASPYRAVPPAVERVVLACLQKDPRSRPAGMREIGQLLRSAVQGEPSRPLRRDETRLAFPLELNANQLDRLQKHLASLIGPIAPILVRQAQALAQDAQDLVERLAEQLPEKQRPSFSQKAMDLLGATPTRPPATNPGAAPSPVLDPNFVQRCERELAHFVGPIAARLVQVASQSSHLTQADLVDRLADQIGDPTKAAQFRRRFLS